MKITSTCFMAACLAAATGLFAQEPASVESLLKEGRNIEAYELALSSASATPNAPSFFWLGEAAQRTGQDQQAIQAFDKAVALQPGFLDALLGLGAVYERQEQWAKAEASYQQAATLYPQQPLAFVRLGDIFSKNGAWARAAEQYRRAAGLAPDDAHVRELLNLCERAADDQERTGVVKANTYIMLAQLSPTERGTGGQATFRGLKTVPDPDTEASEGLRIPIHISFLRGKFAIADLPESARQQLDEVVAVLQSPEWKDRRPLVVEGHACTCGSAAFNLTLGQKRAEAIRQYLIGRNVLRPGDVTAISMGKSNPVAIPAKEELDAAACQRDEAHNQNRRVIIREARAGSTGRVAFWYRPAGQGEFRPLTNGATLKSKDEVKIQIQAFSPVSAYAFHHGSGGEWSVLFPLQASTRSLRTNSLPSGKVQWIPSSASGFVLDDTPGHEETLVFLTPGPDPELDRAVAELTQPAPPVGSNAPPKPPKPPKPESQTTVSFVIPTTRGLQGVKSSKAGDLFVNSRSYASVNFEHVK